jgi:hypothetical protein
MQTTETKDMNTKFLGVPRFEYNRPFATPQQMTMNQIKKIFIIYYVFVSQYTIYTENVTKIQGKI